MGRQALVRELRDRSQTEQAEDKEHWAKGNVHVVSDEIDHSIEHVAVLVERHEGDCEQETDGGGVDGVSCEDHAHSDLGLEASPKDLRVRGQLD